jgi:hypothetical protein
MIPSGARAARPYLIQVLAVSGWRLGAHCLEVGTRRRTRPPKALRSRHRRAPTLRPPASRLRRLKRRLLHESDQHLPLRHLREVQGQVRAVFTVLKVDYGAPFSG